MTCIKCHKLLEPAFEGGTRQPYGGLAVRAYGAYGSTIFDPMDDTYLEFVICDTCLGFAAGMGHIRLIRPSYTEPDPNIEQWVPDRWQ